MVRALFLDIVEYKCNTVHHYIITCQIAKRIYYSFGNDFINVSKREQIFPSR